jgi:hypothetical protein
MSFFNKSDPKKDPSVNQGNVLFPHGTSTEQSATGASGAMLRDGKITFETPPVPSGRPAAIKTQL